MAHRLRDQCCSPDGEIQPGDLCLIDGKPCRFGGWEGNMVFGYVRGVERISAPWTRLKRHLTDAELDKF